MQLQKSKIARRIYLRECAHCREVFRTPRYSGKFICSFCSHKSLYPRVFYKNRKVALARDENTCQCCGENEVKIVHHIDCNKKNNSPSNLITLCGQCHLSLHAKYSNKQLRDGNIYKMFPKKFRWGIFGKREDTGEVIVEKIRKKVSRFTNAKSVRMKSKQIFGTPLRLLGAN